MIILTDGSVDPQSQLGFGAYLAIPGLGLSLTELQTRIKIRRFEQTSSTQLELQTVIWALHDEKLEIFDLQRDPSELKPTKPTDGSQQYELETARLDHWYKATESDAGENRMTEHDVEVLKSLGYLQ